MMGHKLSQESHPKRIASQRIRNSGRCLLILHAMITVASANQTSILPHGMGMGPHLLGPPRTETKQHRCLWRLHATTLLLFQNASCVSLNAQLTVATAAPLTPCNWPPHDSVLAAGQHIIKTAEPISEDNTVIILCLNISTLEGANLQPHLNVGSRPVWKTASASLGSSL